MIEFAFLNVSFNRTNSSGYLTHLLALIQRAGRHTMLEGTLENKNRTYFCVSEMSGGGGGCSGKIKIVLISESFIFYMIPLKPIAERQSTVLNNKELS